MVAHVIIGLEIGGAELMLRRLVLNQKCTSATFDHVVISLASTGAIGRQLMESGVQVYALDLRGILNLPIVFFRLVLLLRKLQPSIVQTWMYHADLIGGLAARLAGVKHVIWNIRNTLIPQGRWSRSQFVIGLCAQLSHWLPRKIVCCAVAARAIHGDMGYAVEKMCDIPNGYDLSVFPDSPELKQHVRTQLGFSNDSVVVGTVGRFDPLKDYANFVQAAKLVGRLRPKVLFMMIGRGVDASNIQLAEWLTNTGFAHRFVLLGERHDVKDLMAAMDIYCLASRAEGFPNVVAEAMAMQVPCVVTNVGDAALIVQDTGYVVPPQSSTDLAHALLAMIDLPYAQRQVLGRRARNIIKNRYSIETVSKQYESLYSSVII
jgi:glycosyltransferase involved in cell wall biosynthesis